MTDNEVIKALECCAFWGECTDCPYDDIAYKSSTDNCTYNSTKDALDLINRQKAEIERLEKLNIIYKGGVDYFKSEAIKEFAERLKASQIITQQSKEGCCVYEFDDELIDNLVEEMCGEKGR